jgi:hyperosmotically inducible protein
MKAKLFTALFAVVALTAALAQDASKERPISQAGIDRIARQVRHELVMLPYYGIFDNLAFKVAPDGSVTLLGQVSRPTLKSDAENVTKKVEGVERVDNQIKVLPVSGNDDQIRRATYRAIYGNSTLAPYSLRAVPPIHIIVDNGHVTLEGVVARQMDKQIAEVQAKSVPGAFSVQNNLMVEQEEKK